MKDFYYVTTGRRVARDQVHALRCPLCTAPAGLHAIGDTNTSSLHGQCGLLLHVFLVSKKGEDPVWECLVTDGYGNKVVERANLAAGKVELVLAEPTAPTDARPGPSLRVTNDGSVGMDVVWVK